MIYYEKMGSSRVFGDWSQWGNTFQFRRTQQSWIESDEYSSMAENNQL